MSRRALRLYAAALVCGAFVAVLDAQSPLTIPRASNIYVTAVDRNGVPVTDLLAADFSVREGGRSGEIVKVERASAEMHIALIVDDSGTGVFRYAVGNFIEQLAGRARFAIKRINSQVQVIADYTASPELLNRALLSLRQSSETPDGGHVVEGIFETARELQTLDVERPVIVVLTDSEAEYSTLPAAHVLDRLRQSRALLYVISVAQVPTRAPAQGGVAPGRTVAIPGQPPTVDRPSDLLDRQMDINQVLGDGPKQTGGRRAEITASGGPIRALQQIAGELNYQYVVTYLMPGTRTNQKISVSVKRSGVTVRAPARTAR
jgi:VWFA-related protein